jgi:hypothetical protein
MTIPAELLRVFSPAANSLKFDQVGIQIPGSVDLFESRFCSLQTIGFPPYDFKKLVFLLLDIAVEMIQFVRKARMPAENSGGQKACWDHESGSRRQLCDQVAV